MTIEELKNNKDYQLLLNSDNPEANRQAIELYNQAQASAPEQKPTQVDKISSGMGDTFNKVTNFLQLNTPNMKPTFGQKPTPQNPGGQSVGMGELAGNAGGELRDLWGMIRHPINTFKGLGDLTRGAVDTGMRAITPPSWNNPQPSSQELMAQEMGRQALPKVKQALQYPLSTAIQSAVDRPLSAATTALGVAGNLPKIVPKPQTAEGLIGKAVDDFFRVIPTNKTLGKPNIAKDAEIMFRDIAENRGIFKLDDFGEEVVGKLPGQLGKKRAMEDFLNVFQQGKANLWKQISDRLGLATSRGGVITDNEIADQLERYAASEGPGLARGNKALATRLADRVAELRADNKTWKLEDAQKWASELNAKVKDVKPGSIDTNSEVRFAAEEARALKEALDNKVMSLSDDGQGVAEIKRKYAAYKSFEKDLRDKLGKSRYQEGHVQDIDLYDIYATSLVTGSIFGGNVAGIPKAIAVKIMEKVGKTEKNINHMITQAFKSVDEAAMKITKAEVKEPGLPKDIDVPTIARRGKMPTEAELESMDAAHRAKRIPPEIQAQGRKLAEEQLKSLPASSRKPAEESARVFAGLPSTTPVTDPFAWNIGNLGMNKSPMYPAHAQPGLAEQTLASLPRRSAEESASVLSRMPPTPRLDATETFSPGFTSPSTLGKKGKVTYSKELGPSEPRFPAERSATVFEEAFQRLTPTDRQKFLNGLKGKQLKYFKELAKEMDALERTEASSALVGKK